MNPPVSPTEVPVSVRVKVHPALCLGWGQCHHWAPDVYTLDEEGQCDLRLVEVPAELAVSAWLGAKACPEGAITVIGPPLEQWLQWARDEAIG